MAANEIRKDDIGIRFTITIQDDGSIVDISAVTTKEILLKKPCGTLLEKSATFTTDGTDGKMYYDSISGDLDQIGSWKIQGHIIFSSSSEFRTDYTSFKVFRNLE